MRFLPNLRLTVRAAALLIAGLAAPDAYAKLPHAGRIPADAGVVLAIPDTAVLQSKLAALPPAATVRLYLQSPEIQQNLDYQQFQLERAKLAEKLGYPVTFEEILGSVLADGALFARMQPGGTPTAGAIFGARDADKARKLVETLSGLVAQWAADAPGAWTTEQTDVGGVNATHFTVVSPETGERVDGYLAYADETVVFATDPRALAICLGQEPPAGGAIGEDADYQSLTGLIPAADAHLLGWINGEAILKSIGINMMGSMPGMTAASPREAKVALAAVVGPDNVVTRYASTADPAADNPKVRAGSLDALGFLPAAPLIAIDSRSFDAGDLYGEFNRAMNDPMLGMALGNAGAPSPLARMEAALGISIENDLIPLLGNEIFMAINQITPNLFMPSIDVVAGARLRDPAAMKSLMRRIEETVSQGGAAYAAGGTTDTGPRSLFSTVLHNGIEIRTMEVAMPLAPTYAVADDWLLIGMSPAAVSAALDRNGSGQGSIAGSGPLRALAARAGQNPHYEFYLFDLAKINAMIVQPLMMQFTNYQTGKPPVPEIVLQLIGHMDHVAALSFQQNGKLVGDVALQMR
jgi:hypothetical protein